MAFADRFLTLGRDAHSGEVLARGGDPEAHSILQRTGFVPVVRLHETYHRLPIGLDIAEEERLATRVVARLRAVRYHVDADDAFDTETREAHYQPLGSLVADLAERIREATTSGEVADALTELTASHDGVLIALGDVLTATAAFYQGLGQAPDPHTAKRLQYLGEHRLGVIRSDLTHAQRPRRPAPEPPPAPRLHRRRRAGRTRSLRHLRLSCTSVAPDHQPRPRTHRSGPGKQAALSPAPIPFEETMHDPTPDTGLGSFVAVLAGELPGAWTSTYHPDHGGTNDHDALTDHVWDMNDVADTLAKYTVDHYAVLTRDDGSRLFVADPLGHGEGYLIAAMAPTDAPDEAFRGVREPDGIAVDADPFSAAEDIHYDLLPRYDKALAQVRANAARLDAAGHRAGTRGDDLVRRRPRRRQARPRRHRPGPDRLRLRPRRGERRLRPVR